MKVHILRKKSDLAAFKALGELNKLQPNVFLALVQSTNYGGKFRRTEFMSTEDGQLKQITAGQMEDFVDPFDTTKLLTVEDLKDHLARREMKKQAAIRKRAQRGPVRRRKNVAPKKYKAPVEETFQWNPQSNPRCA